jgi:hypothetical protein
VLDKLLSCEIIYDRTVNYATQQNHVPVVKKLSITNHTENTYNNVILRIESEPDFCICYEANIDMLLAGETLDLGSVDIMLSPTFLANLNERISGVIKLTIQWQDNILLKQNYSIDVLAFDEWNGFSVIPEIIAAFVTPNQKFIGKILNNASELLGRFTGTPALEGYQSRSPQRVVHQLGAIYSALQGCNITYSNPPASFEESGQKVRLPDTIMEQRLGTCLDTTLLFAACAEAIGINPLIIFSKGHAYVGFWLIDETFSECIQDDFTVITKRIAEGIGQICIIETTLLTIIGSTFSKACEEAEKRLYSSEGFHFLIDIKRCRMSGIRPLPQRKYGNNSLVLEEEKKIKAEAPKKYEVNTINIAEEYSVEKSFEDRKLDQWQRRLLDLSLRNSLINFRINSAGVPLISPQIHIFEDALAEGNTFQILGKPADWDFTARDLDTYKKRNDVDPIIQLLNEEFKQKRIRSFLTSEDLNTRLTQIYRSARNIMEENGSNTLYLAMGFLLWYETSTSEKPRFAPILLLPIEMVRKSVQSGYSIRTREEEAQINITLIEMLKQDFGIDASTLYPLPMDDYGVDVMKLLAKLRNIIMHMPRWDVIDQSHLGLFSFSKFVMWNDLRARSKDLQRNKIVSSLMSGRLSWIPKEFEKVNLDEKYSPKDIFCPISADSSQLSAIIAAANNKSFILHGPPGTGKSQTITNIIANALGSGKTVLFVAEKMAALSVVQKRLASIGLAPFCLEIYSNKAKKRHVLEQLKTASEIIRIKSPENWTKDSEKINELRKKLNGYVEAMHKERNIGHSIHYGISELSRLHLIGGVINIKPEQAKGISREDFEGFKTLVHKLAVSASACGEPHRSPYCGIEREDYSIAVKEAVIEYSKDILDILKKLKVAAVGAESTLSIKITGGPYKAFEAAGVVTKALLNIPKVNSDVLSDNDLEGLKDEINSLSNIGEKRDGLRAQLLLRYSEDVLNLNIKEILGELRAANSKWFLAKYLAQNKVIKALSGYIKAGLKVQRVSLLQEVELMDEIKALQGKLDASDYDIKKYFKAQWKNSFADWKELKRVCDWVIDVVKATKTISGILERPVREVTTKIGLFVEEGLTEDNRAYNAFTQYSLIMEELSNKWDMLSNALVTNYNISLKGENEFNWLEGFETKLRGFIDGVDGLRDYCYFVRSKNEALAAGLDNVVEPLIQGRIHSNYIEEVFLYNFYKMWLQLETSEEKLLAHFVRSDFEDSIKSFNDLDEQFAYLTQQEVYSRLAARVPNMMQDAISSSEPGILQRAIRNGGRGLSIRKLFDSIPNLLPRLTPCLLMSPISVAQYLDPNFPEFDLVIFDEASQMPTSEAVGAMARGRDVIVVGDPNQLPPTSFFSSAQAENDEDDLSIMDMESILDDCLSLNLPQLHLLWHYRSKHESLIAFSNKEYYHNKLVTFPSPDDLNSKVAYRYVEGIYDRGRTKHNVKEAEAVVRELFERLSYHSEANRSIGIVTFNSIQQGLIQDMIDEQLKKNPHFEKYFNDEAAEPVFVKNLENVQGDERDVILFSIGYGPDKEGRIAMNFGPLNREGGWRRLNVAVSRARYEMLIFSSLKSSDINLSRTNAKGVIGLKSFLEYAERGKGITKVIYNKAKSGVDFTQDIAATLKAKGYAVGEDVGCSDYKVDLAIASEENSSYVLGIQCDGVNYARANTTRDRDKLRELVLKQLGWNIIKVWAIDWWENPQREIKRIEEEFNRLSGSSKEMHMTNNAVPLTFKPEEHNLEISEDKKHGDNISEKRKIAYIAAELEPVGTFSEEFHTLSGEKVLKKQLKKIVETEAPISKNLLTKRVISPWGISRSGARIDARIIDLCTKLNFYTTISNGTVFYWKDVTSVQAYDYYRVSENEASRRNPEDIAQQEYISALRHILEQAISLPEGDLIKETAKSFGYQRMGMNLDTLIRESINNALSNKLILRAENGNYILNEDK